MFICTSYSFPENVFILKLLNVEHLNVTYTAHRYPAPPEDPCPKLWRIPPETLLLEVQKKIQAINKYAPYTFCSLFQALTLTEIKQIPTLTLLALPPEELAPFNIAQLWSLGNKSLLATPGQLNPRLDIFIAGHPSGSSNLAISAYLTILTNLILIIPYVL